MADAVRENDTIVQVGYIYQYHPNFHRARDIIQNNILRDIKQANIVFGTSGPKEQGWRFDRNKNPQGILGEITTHLLDFYLSCFDGTPEVVSANLSSEKYSIIDEAELKLHIGDTEINLVTNWTQVGNRVHNHIIHGKNGWIEITDQFLKGNINGEDINVKYGVSPTVDIRSADGKLFDLFLGKGKMDIQTKRIVDFIDHVAERNRETVAPIERGVNITKIVEDAYEKR
jgi:predicted dehydrogenase